MVKFKQIFLVNKINNIYQYMKRLLFFNNIECRVKSKYKLLLFFNN
jgi:hypothetical protein